MKMDKSGVDKIVMVLKEYAVLEGA